MAYTFDIGLWITKDLEYYGEGRPRDALNKFIPENFIEAGHDINLTVYYETPNPPAESVNKDSHWPASDDPCPDWRYGKTFDNLLAWWKQWHDCNDATVHSDANVLVSNYDSSGGLTTGDCDKEGNHYCVAEGHRVGKLADEWIDSTGKAMRYRQMYSTVIHEIGHAVIDETGSFSCEGDAVEEERMGRSWESWGDTYFTPMVTFVDSSESKYENECCSNVAEDPGYYQRYYKRSYSQCVQDHLVNCKNKY